MNTTGEQLKVKNARPKSSINSGRKRTSLYNRDLEATVPSRQMRLMESTQAVSSTLHGDETVKNTYGDYSSA
jgi:hypothetical protein